MAIFSLNHSFIGRTTHAAGSASLFGRYISRPEACTELFGARMTSDRYELMRWLDREEQNDRKNARVIDKVVVALPIELSHEQNMELLWDYCEGMTKGRASWIAAIHDGPKDHDNPHAHIIFRDRDYETGKRVMLTSERGSTEPFREGWENAANRALERAGFEERIDRRDLAAQGIEREPQLHVGAGAEKLAERGHEFQSAQKEVTRLIHGRRETVTINYPEIDRGSTRAEENEARKERNLARAAGIEVERMPDGRIVPLIDEAYARSMGVREVRTQTFGNPQHPLSPDYSGETPPMRSASNDADERTGNPDHVFSPDFRRRAAMESVHEAEVRLSLTYQQIALLGDGGQFGANEDALIQIAVDHYGERQRHEEPALEHHMLEFEVDREPSERAPRRDGFDLFGGGALAAMSRIGKSLMTLFESNPIGRVTREGDEMAKDRPIEQVVEEQQKQSEQDLSAARRAELDAFLAQRDRERHIDRGRPAR